MGMRSPVWITPLALSCAALALAEGPTTPAVSAEGADVAVVARFNGGQITVDDLNRRIAQMPSAMGAQYGSDELKRELYSETLQFILLSQEAKRRGYGRRPEVRSAVKESAVQALIREEVDQKITTADVDGDAVQAYYREHKREYQRPELRRISHIEVADRAEAEELRATLRDQDLKAFREAAQRKSLDERSKLRGGDLRFFDDQGRAPVAGDGTTAAPALVQAAFAVPELGALFPRAVPHDDHFSVVMLTGRRPAQRRELQDAEEEIRNRLLHERRQRALSAFIDQLKTRYQPKVQPERIAWVTLSTDTRSTSPTGRGIPAGFPADPPPPPGAAPAAHAE